MGISIAFDNLPSPRQLVLNPLARGLAGGPKFKVLKSVVGSVAVDMVDIFFGEKVATQMCGHDNPMLWDPPAIDSNDPVPTLCNVIPEDVWTPGLKAVKATVVSDPHPVSITHSVVVSAPTATLYAAKFRTNSRRLVPRKLLSLAKHSPVGAANSSTFNSPVITLRYFANLVHNGSSITQGR